MHNLDLTWRTPGQKQINHESGYPHCRRPWPVKPHLFVAEIVGPARKNTAALDIGLVPRVLVHQANDPELSNVDSRALAAGIPLYVIRSDWRACMRSFQILDIAFVEYVCRSVAGCWNLHNDLDRASLLPVLACRLHLRRAPPRNCCFLAASERVFRRGPLPDNLVTHGPRAPRGLKTFRCSMQPKDDPLGP